MSETIRGVRWPNNHTVFFAGRPLNLLKLSREHKGLNHSSLSRIFSGDRRPSLYYLERLPPLFSMTMEEFLSELEKHTRK